MGQIIVNIVGGIPNYQVDLLIGIAKIYTFTFLTPGQKTLTNISAGEYKVIVTDGNGCVVWDESTIVCNDDCGGSGNIILEGDVLGNGVTGTPIPTNLKTVNSNVGTFGDKSNVPQITVDAKGRVTSVVNVLIGEFGDLDGGCSNTVYLVVQNIDCNL